VISATESSNKFQKTRFWKEKSVEDVVTLGQGCCKIYVKHKQKQNSRFVYVVFCKMFCATHVKKMKKL
jgi:hypothetical protein